MRVLMFGWEFPPHISGGLGTACYGMTQALAKKGVEITFVLPHAKEAAKQNGFLRLVEASGTPISPETEERLTWAGQEIWRQSIRYLPLDSPSPPTSRPAAMPKRWGSCAAKAGKRLRTRLSKAAIEPTPCAAATARTS